MNVPLYPQGIALGSHPIQIYVYCKAWWYMCVIPVLGRLILEDFEFNTSLGYAVRSCLKKQQQTKKKKKKEKNPYMLKSLM